MVNAENVWWCGAPTDGCRKRQASWATAAIDKKTKARKWLYVPTPIQALWHEATLVPQTTRLGVGGAAGPGKSRWGRETLYWFAQRVPGLHALLLRKTHKDLDQSHLRFMPHEVHRLGGSYTKGPPAIATFAHKGEPDSVIRAGHLEDARDIENYLSSEYDIIFPDEIVTFERDPMLELFSRARTTNPHMMKLRGLDDPDPDRRLDGAFVMTATNPGGRGALWFKDFFMTGAVDRSEFPKYNPSRWAFFPARLADNPYMAAGYRQTLEDLPEMRRRQLLDGDWDAWDGQYFPEWRAQRNGTPWHVQELVA